MSELINKNDNRATIRWKLLTSASAVALIASAYAAGDALAADDDSGKAQVWIELGAQLERASGGDDAFVPEFYSHLNPEFDSPTKLQNELPWSLGPEAKISLQPGNSSWIFSAGIRYGRASNHRGTHQQSKPKSGEFYNISKFYTNGGGHYYTSFKCCTTIPVIPRHVEFADVQSRHQESHLILDFQAGKDVGLGMFGKGSSSVVSAGVRFAQFRTKSDISVKARGDLEHYNMLTLPSYSFFLSQTPQKYRVATRFRTYSLAAGSERDTKLIGPSLSWEASAALAGNPETSEN